LFTLETSTTTLIDYVCDRELQKKGKVYDGMSSNNIQFMPSFTNIDVFVYDIHALGRVSELRKGHTPAAQI
jgi:hypothetical protein